MSSQDSEADEERRRQEKAQRKAEWEAAHGGRTPARKPRLSKKERRELQERQKAAKQQKNADSAPASSAGSASDGSAHLGDAKTSPNNTSKNQKMKRRQSSSQQSTQQREFEDFQNKGLPWLAHLSPFRPDKSSAAMEPNLEKIHPAVVALGLKYAQGVVRGGNQRVVAMLEAFKEVIRDYLPPENSAVARDLDKRIKPMIQFLINCRPHSIAMGNAIKELRSAISKCPPGAPLEESKRDLFEKIDMYIKTNVSLAQEQIIRYGLSKIDNGDILLCFSRSSVVERLLLEAHRLGRRFKAIVVDSRPMHEGKTFVKNLASVGIDCVFVTLSSVSYVMPSANKVILGALAMFSNGAMLNHAGAAQVAMVAKNLNKPVLVCCETHKFTEKVQLDSICNNEHGDPRALQLLVDVEHEKLVFDVISLRYDVTPSNCIDTLVTEFGLIPTSSVPVVVREKEVPIF